jgi:SAM-dependent methyltransferase
MSGEHPCPVCGDPTPSSVVQIRDVPVFCNQLCRSRDEALGAARADIELAACGGCGHVFNAAFDPDKVQYGPEYENSLHFSGRFQQYADALAEELVRDHGLEGEQVVEIGCGRGDFLKALCSRGGSTGYGFDPSYPGGDGEADGRVTIRAVPFDAAHAGGLDPALVCCRHTLEHIEDPVGFLRSVHGALGPEARAGVFFEVPNADYMLREGAIWDLIYEHCGYFSSSSLTRAFGAAGFRVDRLESTFGNQFLTAHARASNNPAEAGTRADGDFEGDVGGFREQFEARVAGWNERLRSLQQRGLGAVAWGAGSKGTTFVNMLQPADAIRGVVDINPRKHGKYVPVTGHPIVPPEALRDIRPDAVIVMNPIYGDEIRAKLDELGIQAELLYA